MIYQEKKIQCKYQKFNKQDYMPVQHANFGTKAVHFGQQPQPIHGSVNIPIHMSSTYAQKDINSPFGNFDYTRGGNPTRQAFQNCLAALQYGKKCIAFASGCGATASIIHTLKTGDHVVVCDDVYGGTNRYMRLFAEKSFGINCTFVDMIQIENVEKAIKKQTKLIWIETPTNPTMKVIDLDLMIKAIKIAQPEALVVVDNTFATPYLQSPMLMGADITYHSISKYINGHSDVIMGAIVMNSQKIYNKIFLSACSIGANPSPFDCYLALRGLKTLQVRVTQQTCNAYHLAHFMQNNPIVQKIFYPGLKSNPQYEIARKQMRGFGGMISFRIKGEKPEVSKFLKSIKVFILAESLGGVESLAQCPALMTHASVPSEQRAILGITDNLIRLSCGVQSTDDLIQDIDQALKASQK